MNVTKPYVNASESSFIASELFASIISHCMVYVNNTPKRLSQQPVMSLFVNMCSIIRNDCAQEQRKIRPKADKKLLKVIRKKKISLGYKYDDMSM